MSASINTSYQMSSGSASVSGSTFAAYASKSVAGIIPQPKLELFHRLLFVALRGNFFFQTAPVEEDVTDPISVSIPVDFLGYSISFYF
jgi:hypothetical protein